MNGQGVDQHTAMHMSLTLIPLNKAADIAALLTVYTDHNGKVSSRLPIGLGDALSKPPSKGFLG